jgi:hypothetical protein
MGEKKLKKRDIIKSIRRGQKISKENKKREKS